MNFSENLILTDIDGVVLYWEQAFDHWMLERGHSVKEIGTYCIGERYGMHPEQGDMLTKIFSESSYFAKLPPIHDSIKYMKKLHEDHGYCFVAITAVSNDLYLARKKNLESLFGPIMFQRIYHTGSSEGKKEYLKQYEGSGCYFIDDLEKNCEMALPFGLKPLLYTQHYNIDYKNPEIPRVYCWKDIYEIITNNK